MKVLLRLLDHPLLRLFVHKVVGGVLLLAGLTLAMGGQSAPPAGTRYQANWASLNTRPTPEWYDAAKFGIFIHWGVYSVPAYADPNSKIGESYAEWYWHHLGDAGSATQRFHARVYGDKVHYQDFVSGFTAALFDPNAWADLFERSGARYVVLTSKHHDGFALWPSAQAWNWNAVDVGPHRDLAGDLTKAVRAHGLRMGFYYSLYEWYNPLYRSDPERYVTEHMLPQLHDLVNRYHPAVLWTDGEWEHPSAFWHAPAFLAWLFNDSPVRDEIAVNDRWGSETRGKDGGFYTSEYQGTFNKVDMSGRHKWEEDQGMGKSYGYNRVETVENYKSASELLDLLVRDVSRGGNLLLDIGPTADGRIPVIMQERLLQMGAWLHVNGEAIYGTRAWRVPAEKTAQGSEIDYTQKGSTVYALALNWPGRDVVLTTPRPAGRVEAHLLGSPEAVTARFKDGQLHLKLPALAPDTALKAPYVVALTGVQ